MLKVYNSCLNGCVHASRFHEQDEHGRAFHAPLRVYANVRCRSLHVNEDVCAHGHAHVRADGYEDVSVSSRRVRVHVHAYVHESVHEGVYVRGPLSFFLLRKFKLFRLNLSIYFNV